MNEDLAALAALRDRSSVTELLTLYDHDGMTTGEILSHVLAHCHDNPTVAHSIMRVLHQHPDESIRDLAPRLARLMNLPPPRTADGWPLFLDGQP